MNQVPGVTILFKNQPQPAETGVVLSGRARNVKFHDNCLRIFLTRVVVRITQALLFTVVEYLGSMSEIAVIYKSLIVFGKRQPDRLARTIISAPDAGLAVAKRSADH